MIEIKGKYTIANIMIDDVEDECINQVYRMINNPAFTNPIIIMPDTHAGKGSVIGFTMSLTDKIIPNVVGVDIGCGMLSFNVGNDITENKDKLLKIDEKIRSIIPFGNNIQQRSAVSSHYFEKNYPWNVANDIVKKFIIKYNNKFNTDFKPITYTYDWFLNKQKQIGMRQDAEMGIGTLGGGNHFIEVGKSLNGEIWITIHCGSRNFGKQICEYHQNVAKKKLDDKRKIDLSSEIEKIKKSGDKQTISKRISDLKNEYGISFDGTNINGMEFLEGQESIDYYVDMIFTQIYAKFNRARIMENIINTLGCKIKDQIECIHNYINFDDLIIRKGAISSYINERMIIPFNMADGLLICEGKSNSDWNNSSPHGAGRLMSRGNASRNIDLEKFKYSMKNVVSTSVCKSTLDEAPQAYKSAKLIESLIKPTVKILDRVKPILNLKDGGDSMTWKERRELKKKEKNRDLERKEMRKMKR